jgi:hypothetical protein
MMEHLDRPWFGTMAPMPRNDPKLLEFVTCRVLRPFRAFGRTIEVGETIRLQRFDATSLAALGKLTITE